MSLFRAFRHLPCFCSYASCIALALNLVFRCPLPGKYCFSVFYYFFGFCCFLCSPIFLMFSFLGMGKTPESQQEALTKPEAQAG